MKKRTENIKKKEVKEGYFLNLFSDRRTGEETKGTEKTEKIEGPFLVINGKK